MAKVIEQEQQSYKSRLFHFTGMFENTGRHTKSLSIGSASNLESPQEELEKQHIAKGITRYDTAQRAKEELAALKEAKDKMVADMEQMKERFAKLLLGEDMSGGGKGVSSALALSNAFTNLAASIFGEQHRLEPMSAERKARWRKEIDWLLSVTDYVVEFVPSQQKQKDGSNMEIMITRQRTDLHMNVPALRKLDTMLLDCLDNFKDQNEFYYVKDVPDSEKANTKRKDDKWWLPTAKVPPNGLSDNARKFLQYQKDCVNQVLKAAMAINAQTLSEMEIPENYIESLPKVNMEARPALLKISLVFLCSYIQRVHSLSNYLNCVQNGRASLGDSTYKSITVEFFDPDQFLSTMEVSSEHKILDLKNRIEASIVIWRRKMNQKDSKSGWGSAVSIEKRELFEERAETILLLLKHRFPGLPQSALDISKIQYNRDVGQAVLESYSRILESLAFTVLSRIEDVLYADYVTQNPTQASCKRNPLKETPSVPTTPDPYPSPKGDSGETPSSKTLFDFMGWGADQGEGEIKNDPAPEEVPKGDFETKHPHMHKIATIATVVANKKVSYLDNLGGMKSPTSRH